MLVNLAKKQGYQAKMSGRQIVVGNKSNTQNTLSDLPAVGIWPVLRS